MQFNKKIPTFLFLVIYLLSANASSEFLKLPALIDHFYDHQQESKGVTLTTFLIQHYYVEDGTDRDAAEDKKLPFKYPENAIATFLSLKPPHLLIIEEEAPMNSNRFFRNSNDDFLPSQYLDAIWQPPRYTA